MLNYSQSGTHLVRVVHYYTNHKDGQALLQQSDVKETKAAELDLASHGSRSLVQHEEKLDSVKPKKWLHQILIILGERKIAYHT